MNAPDLHVWKWEAAGDADEVHRLLCESDQYTATADAPAPVRNIETTRRRVDTGCVQILRCDGRAAAMFTLTWEPPFAEELSVFPDANTPMYLSRLAVRAEWLERGSMVGVRCIRRAVELATAAGADAIRSEANPDLEAVAALLRMMGFVETVRRQASDGRRRMYLQKNLPRTMPPSASAD